MQRPVQHQIIIRNGFKFVYQFPSKRYYELMPSMNIL